MQTPRAAATLLALALLSAQSGAAETMSGAITADFQPVVDGKITIAEVNAPEDGFLVVWLPKDNKPFHGKAIGIVPVAAGAHTDIAVPLDEDVGPDQTLGIVLHQDTGRAGEFEFELGKDVDIPVMNGRRPVLEVIGTL
jgi:hypothetical protein